MGAHGLQRKKSDGALSQPPKIIRLARLPAVGLLADEALTTTDLNSRV